MKTVRNIYLPVSHSDNVAYLHLGAISNAFSVLFYTSDALPLLIIYKFLFEYLAYIKAHYKLEKVTFFHFPGKNCLTLLTTIF